MQKRTRKLYRKPKSYYVSKRPFKKICWQLYKLLFRSIYLSHFPRIPLVKLISAGNYWSNSSLYSLRRDMISHKCLFWNGFLSTFQTMNFWLKICAMICRAVLSFNRLMKILNHHLPNSMYNILPKAPCLFLLHLSNLFVNFDFNRRLYLKSNCVHRTELRDM